MVLLLDLPSGIGAEPHNSAESGARRIITPEADAHPGVGGGSATLGFSPKLSQPPRRCRQGAMVMMTAELLLSDPEEAFNVIVPAVVVERTIAINFPLNAA
jgi:hypothetical protein